MAVAIAPWNSAERASAPGVSERKRAIIELLPVPNSVSSLAATAADSESESSQPPALRTLEACAARTDEAIATTTARTATGRRKR